MQQSPESPLGWIQILRDLASPLLVFLAGVTGSFITLALERYRRQSEERMEFIRELRKRKLEILNAAETAILNARNVLSQTQGAHSSGNVDYGSILKKLEPIAEDLNKSAIRAGQYNHHLRSMLRELSTEAVKLALFRHGLKMSDFSSSFDRFSVLLDESIDLLADEYTRDVKLKQ